MMRAVILLMCCTSLVYAASDPALTETRYCGPPVRDAKNEIKRRSDVLSAFQRAHPCPSTMQKTGKCPGWQKNHVIPLACGGCDAVANLTWLPISTKTCAAPHCVDQYERKISAADPPIADTATCKNVAVQ